MIIKNLKNCFLHKCQIYQHRKKHCNNNNTVFRYLFEVTTSYNLRQDRIIVILSCLVLKSGAKTKEIHVTLLPAPQYEEPFTISFIITPQYRKFKLYFWIEKLYQHLCQYHHHLQKAIYICSSFL